MAGVLGGQGRRCRSGDGRQRPQAWLGRARRARGGHRRAQQLAQLAPAADLAAVDQHLDRRRGRSCRHRRTPNRRLTDLIRPSGGRGGGWPTPSLTADLHALGGRRADGSSPTPLGGSGAFCPSRGRVGSTNAANLPGSHECPVLPPAAAGRRYIRRSSAARSNGSSSGSLPSQRQGVVRRSRRAGASCAKTEPPPLCFPRLFPAGPAREPIKRGERAGRVLSAGTLQG
jgi:hypothetical protein